MSSEPFGSGVLIADKSAWDRVAHAAVSAPWRGAILAEQIATCSIVLMEMLYSARDQSEFDGIERDFRALRSVPVTRSVIEAAIGALRLLAGIKPLYHRVPLPDALIAAAAADAGLGVLHYDRHFDRLAEVLPFESRWIVPPGSLG